MTSLLEEYSPAWTARRTMAAISVGSAMLSFSTVGIKETLVVRIATIFRFVFIVRSGISAQPRPPSRLSHGESMKIAQGDTLGACRFKARRPVGPA
jgi:hypothetical protein